MNRSTHNIAAARRPDGIGVWWCCLTFFLATAAAACGDDTAASTYSPYSSYDAIAAREDCYTLADRICDYWARCGVLASSEMATCEIEVRDAVRCSAAVDTMFTYNLCIDSLANASCSFAEESTFPPACTGVIVVTP